jgi:hypothetical protein
VIDIVRTIPDVRNQYARIYLFVVKQ